MDKTQFLNRFTTSEKIAILEASETTPTVKLALFELQNESEIHLNSETLIEKVRSLESAGLLAQGRADEILISEPTPHEHKLQLVEGTTFVCTSTCGKTIQFSAFGEGYPSVDENGIPPSNPEQWMGPCDAPN